MQAPIFVSGCNRGGTTLLTSILAAHPDVCNIGRGPFNEGQFIWARAGRDWSRHRWAVAPWVWTLRRTERHATPERIELFRQWMDAERSGGGRMLEKTPANSIRIPFINQIYPECNFVHILRDGRHTSASLMARKVSLAFAARQWVGAHHFALEDLAALPPHRYHILRYEELIADPERALENLCQAVSLNFTGVRRDHLLRTARAQIRPADTRWERLADWKKHYLLRVAAATQARLGYPVAL